MRRGLIGGGTASCLAATLALAITSAVAQTSGPDVVVKGATETARPAPKRGIWRRAEAPHVVVFSKGTEIELTRVTRNLESLYRLMSRLYRHNDQSDATVKLQVTLLDAQKTFDGLALPHGVWSEGPYIAGFAEQPYYDTREDGSIIAMARTPDVINLDTQKAYNADCDNALSEGAPNCPTEYPTKPPAVRSWEARLYAAFARHFVLTYTPAAYPRWYLDGVGALFSTLRVRGDGGVDYAHAPNDYKQVFRSYGDLMVGDVLTGRYLTPSRDQAAWTPYHAWLIAHYFLFSPLKPERAAQFRAYMTAVHQGKPLGVAARAFGDLRRLDGEVQRYVAVDKFFARAAPPPPSDREPVVTVLSAAESALVEARIERDARPRQSVDTVATDAHGADWLARVQGMVAAFPDDADVLSFAADAECAAGDAAVCLADAQRALARSSDDVTALTWKGVALTDLVLAGPPANRAVGLAAARQALTRAIALDGEAPMPRIAYFQSFTKAGERVPDAAMDGLARAIRMVPAAPAPRLYLAQELVRQGHADVARRVVQTLLYGADGSPEKTAADKLLAAS